MKKYIVIPARLESKRLPRKLLLNKTGRPLIQHTWENVVNQCGWADIYIATDNQEISEVCNGFGAQVIMTDKASCGTERMYLASKELGDGFYVNVQGDLPILDLNPFPKCIQDVYNGYIDIIGLHYNIKTTKTLKNNHQTCCMTGPQVNYNRTKVVFGQDLESFQNGNHVLYYSREHIPHKAEYVDINIGVYAMRKATLDNIYNYAITHPIINITENLEQLLWLENGYIIHSYKTSPTTSIDTEEDYRQFIDKIK